MRTAFIVIAVAAPFIAGCSSPTASSSSPTNSTTASIVSIARRVSKWNSDMVVITARNADGLMGSKTVLISRLACKVGDDVSATVQGSTIQIDGKACVSGS
jgi:hypothetical protein